MLLTNDPASRDGSHPAEQAPKEQAPAEEELLEVFLEREFVHQISNLLIDSPVSKVCWLPVCR
jgi:hypothetical protein